MNAFIHFLLKLRNNNKHAITKPIKNMISTRLQITELNKSVSRPFQLPPFKNFV